MIIKKVDHIKLNQIYVYIYLIINDGVGYQSI